MKKSVNYIEENLSLDSIKKNVLYGRYKGFEITVYIGKISTAYINYYHAFDINEKLTNNIIDTNENKFVRYELEELGIKLTVGGWLRKLNLELLVEKVNEVIDLLIKEKINPNICASGGYDYNETDTIKVINNRYIKIGPKGLDLIKYHEEDLKRREAEIPNNYLRGILGIIAGAICAAAIWIAVELIGFFSPIAWVFSIILGDIFYTMLRGKNNKYKLIALAIISIVVMVTTTLATYAVIANKYIADSNLDSTIFEVWVNDYNFNQLIVNRLVFNSLFLAIGMALKGSEYYEVYTKKRVKITDMPETKHKHTKE